jgi:two-component system CitB family response regulator
VISTVIVEDDFRVAGLHAEVVAEVPGYRVAAQVHSASAAMSAATRHRPDLVLLDLYLPDAPGLSLMQRLRAVAEPPDVVVLTAARDMPSVRRALRYGALAYLIKPFDYERLRDVLVRYAERRARSAGDGETDQADVDDLLALMAPSGERRLTLPKGLSPATAGLILGALEHAPGPVSASELADEVGLSRATVQRYVAQLADSGSIKRTMRYGATGRPEHRYHMGSGRPV